MFYIVKLGDKKYYSKEFVKNVRKLGDAGIVREIEKGTLKTRKILSMVVYELDDKEVSNINLTEAGVQTQDLKETVKNFKAATEASVKLDQPRDHCMISHVICSRSATWLVHDSQVISA